jgi:hypothetical protein
MPPYRQRLRDWLLGSRGKRKLLEALLLGEQPAAGWTRTQLARAAGQHPKARIDLYVRPLVQVQLLIEDGARYRVALDNRLAEPLRDLLELIDQLPDLEL